MAKHGEPSSDQFVSIQKKPSKNWQGKRKWR